jgi:copper(I)-binding protein
MRHNLGGYQLLLRDLKQAIKDGDRFDLTMTFEHAGSETVKVYVQSAYQETTEEHKH